MSQKGSVIMVLVLVLLNCLLGASADYNTSLSMCGNPSSPKSSEGYECTGALFTAVDINKLNTLKNEHGCVAGMLGLSTQLKGYHCLSFRNCPGAGCTCEVRQGCSSEKDSNAKACLYGISEVNECPADTPAQLAQGSSSGDNTASFAASTKLARTIVAALAGILGSTVAGLQ